jgi:OmcA/MtrC family decaheme c-type cytochrome
MSTKKVLVLIGTLIVAAVILVACGGTTPVAPAAPAGTDAPAAPTEAPAAPAAAPVKDVALEPETCGICHKGAGANHQKSYDGLYQDGVIKVSDVTYKFTAAPDTTVVTFKMTKNGAPIGKVENLNIYFVGYTGTSFELASAARLSIKGKISYDAATGVTTSKLVELDPADKAYVDYSDVSKMDGVIVVYGYDKQLGSLPARIKQVQYPYAALLQTGKGATGYVSAANASGCENCHSVPYLKHGNIYAEVNKDPATDFVTCKACHLDNGAGGHFEWQLTADDPAAGAEFLAAGEEAATPEIKQKYGYKTTLMNDVHMSHAMEFPYPQSMSNCVTCHEGKLDKVLTDANFKIETCKSCHPVTGSVKKDGDTVIYDTTTFALKTIMPSDHKLEDDCAVCHVEGKVAPTFKKIHNGGYNKAIFTADGKKYSEAVTVTIDSAKFADNKLTFAFSAVAKDIEGIDVASIKPTVMVGLYGWDTKDYIIGPHERLKDDNGDGKIDSKDGRALEYVVGEENPRFTTGSAAGGKWEVTADLSNWKDLLADGTVKRVEIAVMPALTNAEKVMLALNAPSRTFDLGKNDFDDKFYAPIVKVTDGCNTCHEALGTTFHTPDRGGNVVVCRMCHIVKAGGSHLELQSRSIDSYVHSIHMAQQFDIGDIDFGDPALAEKYAIESEMPFPRHGATDCESCHVKGAYEVPDQTKSLPGILSGTDALKGKERKIGEIPSYIVGPATRACGGCHRARVIIEDKPGELAMLFRHWTDGGYVVESGEKPVDTLSMVIGKIKDIFKY